MDWSRPSCDARKPSFLSSLSDTSQVINEVLPVANGANGGPHKVDRSPQKSDSKSSSIPVVPSSVANSKALELSVVPSSMESSDSSLQKTTGSSLPKPAISLDALLPYTLIGYVQLIYNSIISLGFIYLFYLCLSTLYSDYQLKLVTLLREADIRRQDCHTQYRDNQCDNPLPALLEACQRWRRCANESPDDIYKIPIILELFSVWLNLFLEKLSYRTMIILACALFLLTIFANAVFSLAKSRALFHNKIQY